MTASGRYFSPEEDALLRESYADTDTVELANQLGRAVLAVWRRAARLGLKKSREFIIETGRRNADRCLTTRFQKGLIPWNKGISYAQRGPALQSQYKPGHQPHNTQPMGHERITKDGYLERKVMDQSPSKTGMSNFRMVHILLWEQHHGPVPPGHIVVFRNGDKRDIRIENLELITRVENLRRNSVHNLPPEMKAALAAKARLTRVIHEMEKANEEPHGRSS